MFLTLQNKTTICNDFFLAKMAALTNCGKVILNFLLTLIRNKMKNLRIKENSATETNVVIVFRISRKMFIY